MVPTMLKRHGPTLTLAAILVSATGLAVVWVFLVPIFQAPDEPMNLDYSLAILEHGGPFCVYGATYESLPRIVHPYTDYLVEQTEAEEIAFRWWRKVAPEYGTWDYYKAVEAGAPSRCGLDIDTPNKSFAAYPFGYYSLVALWLACLSVVSDGPVFLFFGARLLSVILLGGTLALIDATIRRLGHGRGFALLLTAAIGFFPLTSFVASGVLMDNLTFFLVSLCFYLALQARRQPGRQRTFIGLGAALGALLITKVHFYLCVLIPVVPMLLLEMRAAGLSVRRRLLLLGCLLVPSLAGAAAYLGTSWGTSNLFAAAAEHQEDGLWHTLYWFQAAFLDYYSGLAHDSFWGKFGWIDTPLIIWGRRTTQVVRWLIQALAWVLLALTLLRLEQVTSRLFRVVRRGRGAWAARIALSNPVINSYFLFTVLMFVLYIHTQNRFGAQGRQWWPMLLPIFLTGIVYAPRALTLRSARVVLSASLLTALLCYCALGSIYALRTIERRYYPNEREVRELTVLPGPRADGAVPLER
jgi:4-amino-4-deoxy-L-arabinose transferase-like glycosyltransferase